jgi:hypothetical protein
MNNKKLFFPVWSPIFTWDVFVCAVILPFRIAESARALIKVFNWWNFILAVQLHSPLVKSKFIFSNTGVWDTARNRADFLAHLGAIESDALGAEIRVDHVNVISRSNRLIWAFGLTSSTVDAIFCYHRRHLGFL